MSSTFQISLAVAGGLVLAGVVAHSAWSARKNQPKRATPETMAETDTEKAPLVAQTGEGGEAYQRQEPSFDADTGPDSEPSLAALTRLTTPEKKPGLDALIDVIAPVMVESVVSGEAALAAMPATRRAGSKPFGVEGLSVASGEWELPSPGQRYSAFQCGVQLANRTGALNQIEYSEFVMKAQAFADAVSGEPEFPEMQDEVARARELDNFASGHDAQLSFTLRALHTAWSPGYVQQSAARIGFVAGSIPGRMVLPASQSGHAPILGLAFDTQAAMADDPEQTALREITLSLDVPQVLRAEQPFARMCEAAIALAKSMDGVIIDDNGNPIRPEAMEGIHADLEQLYDTLDERDLSAGSALGRRLFS
ncbi:cell division protein ZipA C-terminal FtsZ-binding domain-containing protein [Polaromonas sp.]|uniref:cell division protein ZipA C-terminal FtsZ-binding domain-containing protein n=1 Tax=Polaromonas sp. TaxID=1869339 RepID=UPI00286CA94B|nr:cell division protein ZipA C-terminal FtsZ-binding domain-containing protein [Polaromonas sp.]